MSHENHFSSSEIVPHFYSGVLPATDSILRALIAKNDSGEIRLRNYVPYYSPQGVSIERQSTEELITPPTSLARTINDQVSITGLIKVGSPFDTMHISRLQEEHRATDGGDRELELLCTYITLLDYGGKADRVEVQFDPNAGPAVHITANESADKVVITSDVVAALRAAQQMSTCELIPSLSEVEVQVLHEEITPPKDPHKRIIGSVALAIDRLVVRTQDDPR